MSGQVVVVGGGAAGFFGAIHVAELAPQARVVLLEKSSQFLGKVRISGGGRCNVTHACFDARELVKRYPRGSRALTGPFTKFGAEDVIQWFGARGVELKREPDGRMFPVTDDSATVVQCLMRAARDAGVELGTGVGVEKLERTEQGMRVVSAAGETWDAHSVLIASGGSRALAMAKPWAALGHNIVEPVPSLFTFNIEAPWLTALAGVSLPLAGAKVSGTSLAESGPLLITHWGLSGPVILRLSAWGARELHGLDYRFEIVVDWTGGMTRPALEERFAEAGQLHGAKKIPGDPKARIPLRLWQTLCQQAGVGPDQKWSELRRELRMALVEQLCATRFSVSGKSVNKDEFVTCGGVSLKEVDLRTMESRLVPGLYFAGEVLDIDGITGGFNFQSAWTTGWLAGRAMADALGGQAAT